MRLALSVRPQEYRRWLVKLAAQNEDGYVGQVGEHAFSPLDNWLQAELGFYCTLEFTKDGASYLRVHDSERESELSVRLPAWIHPLHVLYTRTPRRRGSRQNDITALGALSDLEKLVKFPTRQRKKHGISPAA